LKSINSPTYDILNIIINNKTTKRDLIVKMKKKKIIKKRIKDLINQGIIKKQGGLKLTPFGIIVVKFFIIVKKNFKLRVEG
jgi:superfamily II helicase